MLNILYTYKCCRLKSSKECCNKFSLKKDPWGRAFFFFFPKERKRKWENWLSPPTTKEKTVEFSTQKKKGHSQKLPNSIHKTRLLLLPTKQTFCTHPFSSSQVLYFITGNQILLKVMPIFWNGSVCLRETLLRLMGLTLLMDELWSERWEIRKWWQRILYSTHIRKKKKFSNYQNTEKFSRWFTTTVQLKITFPTFSYIPDSWRWREALFGAEITLILFVCYKSLLSCTCNYSHKSFTFSSQFFLWIHIHFKSFIKFCIKKIKSNYKILPKFSIINFDTIQKWNFMGYITWLITTKLFLPKIRMKCTHLFAEFCRFFFFFG